MLRVPLRGSFRSPARARRLAFAAALTTVAAVGCSSDSTTAPESIAGSYQANTLTLSQAGQSLDALARGVKLSLSINSSNATTGTLYTPASLNGGVEETLNFTATAVRTGNTVRFNNTSEDALVGELTFTASGNTLRADQTLSNVRYVVVLTRQ